MGPTEHNAETGASTTVYFGVTNNEVSVIKWANDQGYLGIVQVRHESFVVVTSRIKETSLRDVTLELFLSLYPTSLPSLFLLDLQELTDEAETLIYYAEKEQLVLTTSGCTMLLLAKDEADAGWPFCDLVLVAWGRELCTSLFGTVIP